MKGYVITAAIGFLIGLPISAVLIEFAIWSGNPHPETILTRSDSIIFKNMEDFLK